MQVLTIGNRLALIMCLLLGIPIYLCGAEGVVLDELGLDTGVEKEAADVDNVSYTSTTPKQWNFLVHIAANNNLAKYAKINLNQMTNVGSSRNVNIIVQIELPNTREMLRLYISSHKIYVLQRITASADINTGTKESLTSFVKWATTRYPSQHTALVIWNHGSGALDRVQESKLPTRGIAFNDAYGTYLSNEDFQEALQEIVVESFQGKKIALMCQDACYQSMIEVASHVKGAVEVMVGSSNVEPAAGYNYEDVLALLKTMQLEPIEFAQHIVECYKKSYEKSFPKYTHTALSLDRVEGLEENISSVAAQLSKLLQSDHRERVLEILRLIRFSKMYTTSFNNLDYIDLWHFYESLLFKLPEITEPSLASNIATLIDTIKDGIKRLKETVIQHEAGNYVRSSHGVAIYFPLKKMHPSYPTNLFAQSNDWYPFISEFLDKLNSSLIFML